MKVEKVGEETIIRLNNDEANKLEDVSETEHLKHLLVNAISKKTDDEAWAPVRLFAIELLNELNK